MGVAAGDHDFHADHLGAGGVGAVGGRRDQADRAVALAPGPLPGLDHEQAGILPLAAGIGLQADAGIAGGLAEPVAELAFQDPIALQLVGGGERVDVRELRPGDRDHLAGGVEFHRAAAQRDHAAVEREILVAQRADVAEHRGFAVVRVEDRMREEVARPPQCGRDQRLDALFIGAEVGHRLPRRREHLQEPHEIVAGRGLVERDRERVGIEGPQVHAEFAGPRGRSRGAVAHFEAERVEGVGMSDPHAQPLERVGQHRRVGRDALGDPREARRPVIDGVHARHHGGQHLRRADVGGGLLATDVLLAGLQGETIGGPSFRIDAHAHEAARHRPLEGVAAGEKGSVRAAAAHRHAEPLRGAGHDVGPPLARRHEQREGQKIGHHAEDGLFRVDPLGEAAPIDHLAIGRGILDQHAEAVVAFEQIAHAADLDLDAQRPGPRLEHLERLRVAAAIRQEHLARARGGSSCERHRLGCGGGLVEQRRVRDRHAGEFADHRLKIDEGLHAALADLCLVGRVGGVPGGVLQDVPQDHAGGVGAVVALADEALEEPVSRCDGLEFREGGCLGDGQRELHGLAAGDARGHDAVHERLA